MENNILTAEEFLLLMKDEDFTLSKSGLKVSKMMIEFAKLHVEAALKEAAYKSECYNKSKFPGDENWVVDMESILNSYPLTNIK